MVRLKSQHIFAKHAHGPCHIAPIIAPGGIGGSQQNHLCRNGVSQTVPTLSAGPKTQTVKHIAKHQPLNGERDLVDLDGDMLAWLASTEMKV